jgi:hypothetical protein
MEKALIMVHKVQFPTKPSAMVEAACHVQKYIKNVEKAKITKVREDGAYWEVTVKYTTKKGV